MACSLPQGLQHRPPATPRVSNLQSKKPQAPSPWVASMHPLVQEARRLDPRSSRTASLERGLLRPLLSHGWLALGEPVGPGPLNVTYCLRGGFRKCQAPIKQPCSLGKTKKGLFIWDLSSLISFSYLPRLSYGVVFKTTSPPSQSEAGAHPAALR